MLRTDILADAGRLVAPHAMVWIRRLDAPVEDVWRLMSTLDGLAKWWIVPPTVLELRPGVTFKHHWENTVHDYRDGEFIDFREPNGSFVGTGGMRLEVSDDGAGSVFAFLDTWAEGVEGVGPPTGRTGHAVARRRGRLAPHGRHPGGGGNGRRRPATRSCATSTLTIWPISIDGATRSNVEPEGAAFGQLIE